MVKTGTGSCAYWYTRSVPGRLRQGRPEKTKGFKVRVTEMREDRGGLGKGGKDQGRSVKD